ncbi:MAG: aromatic ring-hydroxylating dioxygenase subunit alpha [Pseudomonadota bacterium]
MPTQNLLPTYPRQLLPREAYINEAWLEREREQLFSRSWTFAGVVQDFANPGDVRTISAGNHSLIVVKGKDGRLRAFHNLCRHRGTELVEGNCNVGKRLVCPYHNWVYDLDGQLAGVPAQKTCFPDMDRSQVRLHAAALGIYRDLVFVHPDATPAEPFETWLADLDRVPWPHDLSADGLSENSEELVYELKCNWKVFVENALDGYHLAYLHKHTLGGPTPDKNLWEPFGRHLVWWSTERDGVKHRIPAFMEAADKGWTTRAHDDDAVGYGGVYLLFPTTLLTPNPWGFSLSLLEPVDAGTTLLRVRNWAPEGRRSFSYRAKEAPGYDKVSGRIKSSAWTKHPLESGDFQTEDTWACEKVQRGLKSPRHETAFLAAGAGGEAALAYFQQCVIDLMAEAPPSPA